MACRLLVPWPRTEPGPLAVKAWSPNHWTAREFLCIISSFKSKSLPPLMRAVAEASSPPGEDSCRRASLCQQEWSARTVFVCFHISNMSTDSIFFRSFKNPFLCFYPLYLLSCFVSETANSTDFQVMRAWCNPWVQSQPEACIISSMQLVTRDVPLGWS